MRSVALILTSGCNLRCQYCHLQPQPHDTHSWPSLQAALDALLAEGRGDVELMCTGGEPLLALPMLRRAVTHLQHTQAGRRRVTWEIVTNGLRLDEEAAEFLDVHRFHVNLSFDGVREAQAQRGRDTFDTLDARLGRLKVSRPSLFDCVSIAMTVSPPAIAWLVRSVEYFLSKGVATVRMTPASPAQDWAIERIAELDAAFDDVAATCRAHYELTGTVPVTLFRKQRADRPAPKHDWVCGGARPDGVTIDVDGCAYGCVVASKTYQPRTAPVLRDAVAALALGPVDAPDFEERLATMPDRARACGAYTHPEQRYSRYRRCRDCEYLGRCYACPLAAASVPHWDDARRVPDFVCAWNQVTLAHRDGFPCQTTGSAL